MTQKESVMWKQLSFSINYELNKRESIFFTWNRKQLTTKQVGYFYKLHRNISEVSDNDLVWIKRFVDFYRSNGFLSERQLETLKSIHDKYDHLS